MSMSMEWTRQGNATRTPRPTVLLVKGDPLEPLTPRQLEILTLVADGYEREEIAEILFISHATVRTTLTDAFQRLNAKNSIQAINTARHYGFIPLQAEPKTMQEALQLAQRYLSLAEQLPAQAHPAAGEQGA